MILEPREEAIIDAVICQRVNNYSNIFNYDYDRAQEYLNGAGKSVKYAITREDQFDIIQKLSDAGIIDMDYIVNVEFINNLRSTNNSNIQLVKSKERFFWAKQKNWAYEFCQLNGGIELEEVYSKYKSDTFINMTKEDIAYIDKKYRANHVVQMAVDGKRSCLKMKIDKGDWVFFRTLDPQKIPYKILSYAYKCAGRPVDKDELFEEGIITKEERGKYLKTQIFSDNKTVQTLNSLSLMGLNKNEITFIKVKRLTSAKLEALKTSLKII